MANKKGILAGKTSEFKEGDKKIVPNGSSEIGVYFIKGDWYAYQNICPHQGGPLGEGARQQPRQLPRLVRARGAGRHQEETWRARPTYPSPKTCAYNSPSGTGPAQDRVPLPRS